MTSFETLPPEIRREIYAYLLLGNDVIRLPTNPGSNDALLPIFHTAIFRVNKEISAETIGYFYKQNAFVEVALSNADWKMVEGIQSCCLISKFDGDPKACVLSLKVNYRGGKAEEGGANLETISLIVPARRLPLFIRLLNAYSRFMAWHYRIYLSSLEVKSTGQYSHVSPNARASIVSSLKLLRPALIQDQDFTTSTVRIQKHTGVGAPPPDGFELEWPLVSKEALADLKGIAQCVEVLFEQGYFYQAMHICEAASRGVFLNTYFGSDLTKQESCEHLQTKLNMHMIECLLRTKLGQRKEAFRCAYQAQFYYKSRGPEFAGMLNLAHNQIADQVANALTDYGRLGPIKQVCEKYRKALARHRDYEHKSMREELSEIQLELWPDTIGN